jgi:hypothetical protein
MSIHPSILSSLQPWVSLGLLNSQSPFLSVFLLLHPLLYLIRFPNLFRQRLFLILPRLTVGFRNKLFLLCGVVSHTPNPQPGGPGYPFSSGVITLDLSGMGDPTSSIRYRQHSSRLRKPLHYVKVGIPSG